MKFGTNYVPLLQENEMLAGLHSRNLILGLECFFGFLPSERFFLIVFVLVRIKRIRKQEELKIPLCNPSGENLLRQSCQHQRWSSSAKTTNGLNTLTVSAKKLHHRPPIGF